MTLGQFHNWFPLSDRIYDYFVHSLPFRQEIIADEISRENGIHLKNELDCQLIYSF